MARWMVLPSGNSNNYSPSSSWRRMELSLCFVCLIHTLCTAITVWQHPIFPPPLGEPARWLGFPPAILHCRWQMSNLKLYHTRQEKRRYKPMAATLHTWVIMCAYSRPWFMWVGTTPTSVVAGKSMTAWLHSSMENSFENCTCLNLPAFQTVPYHTAFYGVCCWSVHQWQWRKRWSHVSATIHPPPPHLPDWSSSWWLNRHR